MLAGAIALATIWAGDLNIVAPVVSMFFLISYGLLNYATYVEARSHSPYFRPRFHWFHPRLSLLGAVGCLVAMVALDATAAAISSAILFAIFHYIDRRSDIARWADGRRSSRFQRIRQELRGIADELWHPRDWRPVLLVFTNDAARRLRLMHFAAWIEGGAGITTVVKLLPGQGLRVERARETAEDELKEAIEEAQIDAFPLVVTTPDVSSGLSVLLQSMGLGPIRPNTVLMNWFDRHPREDSSPGLESFGTYLQIARHQHCNLVLREATGHDLAVIEKTPGKKRTIDVWFGEDASGPLMLLFAYLMTRDEHWKKATIRLFAGRRPDESAEQTLARVRTMLEDVRIEAEPIVIDVVNEEAIEAGSAGSSVVFLPFRLRGDTLVGGFGIGLADTLEVLPMCALVLAAEDIDLDARPEEGPHGEIAEAMDTASTFTDKFVQATKEAAEAAEMLAAALKDLERARKKNVEPEALAALAAAHERAAEACDRATRRAGKAQAKAMQADHDAQTLREESEE